ncbi:MAG: endonuclease Q family protein [Candidatus Nanoarchaeia archaeon]|nr:endonuclease Q family protein [Candidatus Nanoarchaeia archaeon]
MVEIIADLQIHSRFARATSKDINLDNLEKYARIKGVNLLGTGDFQHPLWNKELKEKLKEDEHGILWSETGFPFIWQTEVSLMFSQGGKRRAIHLLIFAPNNAIADKIVSYLGSKGRLDYDGRPIFGITAELLVKELKEIDDRIEIIPAHCMTPWFGLYGSDSGFDSLNECFASQAGNIHAVESGMSADPSMLWRFKERVNVVSFSDAHSFWPWRIGREATIFEFGELSYKNIIHAIRTGQGLKGTIETPPEYGKYHWDGHRNCNFSCSPQETKKLNGICPMCNRKLTIGVEYRVNEISREKEGYIPENAKPFFKLIPLHELIAFVYDTSMSSKKAWTIYNELISKFENEFNILLKVPKEKFIQEKLNDKLIELIILGREGKIKVKPGYDGVYGEVLPPEAQAKLF